MLPPSAHLASYCASRSSGVASRADLVGGGKPAIPNGVSYAAARRSVYSALWRASISRSIGPLRAGKLKLAVRWNTCRCFACLATIGIICTPDDPVPIAPTRRPVKSTPSCGQRPVWYHLPLNRSMPLKSGTRGVDKLPVAMMQNGAVTTSPLSVFTVQMLRPRSKSAAVTRVLSCTSLRRSNRSATWLMYCKISD